MKLGLAVCLATLVTARALYSSICATCHAKQVEGYAQTGMGKSLGKPRHQPGGSFTHLASGSRLTILSGESGMRHRLERDGREADYEIAYFVGSGHAGRSYLVRLGDYLFQSPASYYSERRRWDMSPGYEPDLRPDFDRPVTPECLFCHSGQPRPVKGTTNRYEDPPFAAEAITCGRCHGPADEHTARPSRNNIVNPARLSRRARDSVCEQCHLDGEARVPNPGRSFFDFRAGMELEEVLSVYVRSSPEPAGRIKVVSHVEQLAQSACAQASGARLWCGSCHDPHNKPADSAESYRERCLACHASSLPAAHGGPSNDCAGCHMPRRASWDGSHTAFTDHRIQRRPSQADTAPELPKKLGAWREPRPEWQERNLGLAYVGAGERYQSVALLQEGFRLLAGVERRFPKDPELLSALGLVLLHKNVPSEAARRFERAAAIEPEEARHFLNAGVAHKAAGATAKALELLERAVEIDPGLLDAYRVLADLHQGDERKRALERYLRIMPQSLRVRGGF